MESVGDRLKYLRKLHGFTQNQIANYLGFKQSQIVKLEKNQRTLMVSSLEDLCDLYNCSEEYILEGKGKYSKPGFAFRTNTKNLDLETMVSMNKIIKNIEYLDNITKEL